MGCFVHQKTQVINPSVPPAFRFISFFQNCHTFVLDMESSLIMWVLLNFCWVREAAYYRSFHKKCGLPIFSFLAIRRFIIKASQKREDFL